jgi:hypothetical protein
MNPNPFALSLSKCLHADRARCCVNAPADTLTDRTP